VSNLTNESLKNTKIWKNLSPQAKNVILELGYESPTEIQQLTFQTIFKGNSIIACSQTGSGKTFAFTFPLALRIKANEKNQGTLIGCPKAIILCPTRELTLQVYSTVNIMGHNIKLSTAPADAGKKIIS